MFGKRIIWMLVLVVFISGCSEQIKELNEDQLKELSLISQQKYLYGEEEDSQQRGRVTSRNYNITFDYTKKGIIDKQLKIDVEGTKPVDLKLIFNETNFEPGSIKITGISDRQQIPSRINREGGIEYNLVGFEGNELFIDFTTPIVENENGEFGNYGTVYLDINGELFWDKTNSSWFNTAYQKRNQLSITNNNNTIVLHDNYTISVDHGAGDSWNSLAIVWNGTGTDLELDRYVNSTTVEFKLQKNLTASAVNTNYTIYHTNRSAVTPKTNITGNKVWMWYDDFEYGDLGLWTESNGPTVCSNCFVYDGSNSINLSRTASGVASISQSHKNSNLMPEIFTFMIEYAHYDDATFNDGTGLPDTDDYWSGQYWANAQAGVVLGGAKTSNPNVYHGVKTDTTWGDSAVTRTTGWHNITVMLYPGEDYEYFIDGTSFIGRQVKQAGLSYNNHLYRGFNVDDAIVADNIKKKMVVSAEPTVTLLGVELLPGNGTASLKPSAPDSDDDLTCTVTNLEGGPMNVSFSWYKDNEFQFRNDVNQSVPSDSTNSSILTTANTTQGESWNCEGRLHNSTFSSGSFNSSSVTVSPLAPTLVGPANNSLELNTVTLSASTTESGNLIFQFYADNAVDPTQIIQQTSLSSAVWDISNNKNKTLNWKVRLRNTVTSLNSNFTEVRTIRNLGNLSFGQCNASQTNDFLNLTYQDESNSNPLNATIQTSTWYYSWDADMLPNKTFTYQNLTTGNDHHIFCANPPTENVYVDSTISYLSGATYPQRTTEKSFNLTSTVKREILYLLSSTDGIYVTFQIINAASQPVANTFTIVSRVISGVNTILEKGNTGDDGGITFFLNPNLVHTINFTATGFDVFTTTLTPTQNLYTQTLGSTTTSNETNYIQGISYDINPKFNTLINGTDYQFNLTVNGSYWSLTSAGFTLTNSSGHILNTTSCASGTSCFTSVVTNTGGLNNTRITMNYFWEVQGNYTNGTRFWVIGQNTVGTPLFEYFKSDFAKLTSAAFGLGDINQNFTKAIISILIIVGIMTFLTLRGGITSPSAILVALFSIVWLLSLIGLMPLINGQKYFISAVVGVMVFAYLAWENLR